MIKFVYNYKVIHLSDDEVRESKGTSKVNPRPGHEGWEVTYWYSFTLSLTSALVGGGWSMPHLSHFIPPRIETRYPLGGPRGQSRWVQKISPQAGFDAKTARLLASRSYWLHELILSWITRALSSIQLNIIVQTQWPCKFPKWEHR